MTTTTTFTTPLVGLAVMTSGTAPTLQKRNVYNASSGAISATLPALSGCNVGARLVVEKYSGDTTVNPVTISCAGSDKFQDGATNQLILTQPGQFRELQVISISGTKYWSVTAASNQLTEISPYSYEVAAGEATLPRLVATNNAVATSAGYTLLAHFTARKTETITSLRAISGGTAASGLTLCQMAVYSEDAAGNLTLVANTANDTSLFTSPNTLYSKALAASFTTVAGTRYAAGIIPVGTTPPSVFGINSIHQRLETSAGLTPRLASFVLGNTLPSTVAVGSLVLSTGVPYIALVP